MELEDDVLFADLSRRIALLITDDDDNGKDLPVCFPSVSLQVHPWSNIVVSFCTDLQYKYYVNQIHLIFSYQVFSLFYFVSWVSFYGLMKSMGDCASSYSPTPWRCLRLSCMSLLRVMTPRSVEESARGRGFSFPAHRCQERRTSQGDLLHWTLTSPTSSLKSQEGLTYLVILTCLAIIIILVRVLGRHE